MKRMIVAAMLCFNLFLSTAVSADPMVISGKPVELLNHPDFYTFPSSYRVTPGYRFIVLNKVKRVCFMNRMPQFSSLDMLPLMFEEQGVKIEWKCYQYNPKFFELDF